MVLDVTGSLQTTIPLPAGESFTFPDVPPGTYTLAVRGINAFGTGPQSNAITLSFPGTCSGVPLPPEEFRVYKAGARVFVYWQPATSGPAPTDYVLNVSGSFTAAIPTPERTLNGTVGPGTYHLSVAGRNACGLGSPTNVQPVTVP